MAISFSTARLQISSINSVDGLTPEQVIGLLSPKVSKNLPAGWQNINTKFSAKTWLQTQLTEGAVLSVQDTTLEQIVGLLFLYGVENNAVNAEIRLGYLIAEQAWGRGYATELIAGVVSYFALNNQATAIVAGVEAANVASVKVLTKNGFRFSHKNEYSDFYIYHFKG